MPPEPQTAAQNTMNQPPERTRSVVLDPPEPGNEPSATPSGTYEVQAACNNCEGAFNVRVRKGTLARVGDKLSEPLCPNCGCAELSRVRNATASEAPATPTNRRFQDIVRRVEEARVQDQFEALRRAEEELRRTPLPRTTQDANRWVSVGQWAPWPSEVESSGNVVQPLTSQEARGAAK